MKLWLNADDILYSALKVIKLFLEERLTRGNFPIVMQGIRTMFSHIFLFNPQQSFKKLYFCQHVYNHWLFQS